jgi:uncharacterized membrane protein
MNRWLRQGRIFNHPMHAFVVHLPIGLWAMSWLCDLAYLISGDARWATTSYYCLKSGVFFALIALVTGMIEFSFLPRGDVPVKSLAGKHAALNALVLVLYVPNALLRTLPVTSFPWVGFVLSTVAIGVLSYSGYLGGRLTYEYGAGSNPRSRPLEDRDLGEAA